MKEKLQALRERLVIDVLRLTPKGALSHVIGWGARRKLPKILRAPLYRGFARQVGANLDEVERPLAEYARFNDFFTRNLVPGARSISSAPGIAVMPCDGRVAEFGDVVDGRMIQCKGRDSSLRGLLGDDAMALGFAGGRFATIYLSPKDYHRVHSPAEGTITGWHHLPGAFYPVNPAAVKHVAGLFTVNERIVTYLDTPLGACALVMVAATGVGHMTMAYDAVETHRKRRKPYRVRYDAPRPIERGGELGAFNLGSTVVMVWQRGRIEWTGLRQGEMVRLGQPMARALAARSGAAA